MRDIKKFLVCGGGMMGSAIAQILAGLDGAEVTVYDVYPVDIEAKVRSNMKLLVEKGIVTEADVDAIVKKISFTQDMQSEGVKNAQLVVECVLEDMQLKQDLFAQLEEVVAEDTIFCTNTSVMSPTEISAKCKHKERLCGTHFWNPAFLIPLARRNDEDNRIIDVFQVVACGTELCKAYSELVNPIQQRKAFEDQLEAKKQGDDETMDLDESFMLAMEHGMPPISGLGCGLDRLLMLIYNQESVRDVVLFPLMK